MHKVVVITEAVPNHYPTPSPPRTRGGSHYPTPALPAHGVGVTHPRVRGGWRVG